MVNFLKGKYYQVSLSTSLPTHAVVAVHHWPGCPPSVYTSVQLRILSILPSVNDLRSAMVICSLHTLKVQHRVAVQ